MTVPTNHKKSPIAYELEYKLLEQIFKLLAKNDENKFSQIIEKVVNEAIKVKKI